MTPRTLIHSARLVSDNTVTDDAWVLFDGDTIEATGRGPAPESAQPAETVDAAGAYLTPGFIDIHGHGGGTASFDDGAESIATALAAHHAHGTTRSVISLVTGPVDDLAARVAGIAELRAANPLILGSHLEGPFLDVGHKGAHEPSLLRSPTEDTVGRLIEAADGTLVQVTIAPELDGGMAAVARFVGAGVRVAVGHTDATYDQAMAAFDAGASILTHAFNAMPGIHHRAPGPVLAAAEAEHVTVELINDGVHVVAPVARMLHELAPGRLALITDAMAATGLHDGSYHLGSLPVEVKDSVARLVTADGTQGAIAGSTLTMDEAVKRAVAEVGLSPFDAVQSAGFVPLRAGGGMPESGDSLHATGGTAGAAGAGSLLAPGMSADLLLLDEDMSIRASSLGD